MFNFREIAWKQRWGWFRIWILLSCAWAIYAASIAKWPWDVERATFYSRSFPLQMDKAFALAEVGKAELATCQPGTTSVSLVTSPPHRRTVQASDDVLLKEMEDRKAQETGQAIVERRIPDPKTMGRGVLDRYLATYVNGSTIREIPGLVSIQASCFEAGAKTRAMGRALLAVFGLPIAVPTILLLVAVILGRTGRWVGEGFAAHASAVAVIAQPPSEAAKSASGTEPPYTSDIAGLKKALGWSCLALVITEMVIRGALSEGRSGGTNLLVFLLLGGVTIVACDQVARKLQVPVWTMGFTAFWSLGALVILVTTARYM